MIKTNPLLLVYDPRYRRSPPRDSNIDWGECTTSGEPTILFLPLVHVVLLMSTTTIWWPSISLRGVVGRAWWLSGNSGALHPESRRFEFHSSRHAWTLGKSFTRNGLLLFGVLTPTQYQCCSRERLWVVVDLKRRYRNIRNKWMNEPMTLSNWEQRTCSMFQYINGSVERMHSALPDVL